MLNIEVESLDLCLVPKSFESFELTLSLFVSKDWTCAFEDLLSGLIT